MEVALGGRSSSPRPGLRIDNLATPDASVDQGQQGPSFDFQEDLGRDLPVTAEDPTHPCVASPRISFCHPRPLAVSLVAPRAAIVGLVHLPRPIGDRWDLATHRLARQQRRPQDPLPRGWLISQPLGSLVSHRSNQRINAAHWSGVNCRGRRCGCKSCRHWPQRRTSRCMRQCFVLSHCAHRSRIHPRAWHSKGERGDYTLQRVA